QLARRTAHTRRLVDHPACGDGLGRRRWRGSRLGVMTERNVRVNTQRPRSALRRRMTRLVQDLTGRSAGRLVERLTAQLDCTARGARLTESLINGRPSSQAHDGMRELEHEGDEIRAVLITELFTVLATPVDAEDLFRLS